MISLKKILVVVADAAEAKFYIAHGPNNLIQVDHLRHKEGRMSNYELTTKEHDINTCPYDAHNSMKQHEKTVFAKEIAELTRIKAEVENLSDVYIFAAPQLLGQINKTTINHNVKVTTINKDLMNADPTEIIGNMRAAGATFMPT